MWKKGMKMNFDVGNSVFRLQRGIYGSSAGGRNEEETIRKDNPESQKEINIRFHR